MEPYDPIDKTFRLPRVLVIESRISVNESLVTLLSEADEIIAFGCAQGPAKVVALVQAVRPEVVILGMDMEGAASLETLRKIKRLPNAPEVIGLSYYDLPPLRQAAAAAGVDCFLVKPTECGRLPEVLHDLLEAGQARRSTRPKAAGAA
jgi:DNA-binding NarL/FixJ family response regulator